jgi:hypothetical protein
METSHTPENDFIKIFRGNIERSNKARCQLCNSWTREKGCDHYGPDVHYKDFDAMVARINNLEAGVLTHARINSDLMKQNAELLEALQEVRSVLLRSQDYFAVNGHTERFEQITNAYNKVQQAISKATEGQ